MISNVSIEFFFLFIKMSENKTFIEFYKIRLRVNVI